MPHVSTDPNRSSWRYGVTLIGKVAAPGSKPMIKGNGRSSLLFTVRIQAGIPFNKSEKDFDDFNFRCMWLDPDFLLYTNDVVEVSGVISRTNKSSDMGMVVNSCQVLARFVSKTKGPGPAELLQPKMD